MNNSNFVMYEFEFPRYPFEFLFHLQVGHVKAVVHIILKSDKVFFKATVIGGQSIYPFCKATDLFRDSDDFKINVCKAIAYHPRQFFKRHLFYHPPNNITGREKEKQPFRII